MKNCHNRSRKYVHYYNSLYYTVASVHLIVNYSSHFPLLHIDYTVFVLIMYGTIDVC